jgi:hypothetical protein
MKRLSIFKVFFLIFILSSCETKQEREKRLALEEKERIELEQNIASEKKAEEVHAEEIRLAQEKQTEIELAQRQAQLEKEREEQEIYNMYISNSLRTGSTPYSKYYGRNSSCNNYGCSQVNVITSNSDVIVTIKKNNKVVRHAYIQSGDQYTFSFPDGIYQVFFYYGKGWNPNKEVKGGTMRGGFIADEDFGKDDPQSLVNSVLTYELILQQNGNFSTRPSNLDEVL